MWWEPWFERGSLCSFALAVYVAESVERAAENEEIGYGDSQHKPVDSIEGPHGLPAPVDYFGGCFLSEARKLCGLGKGSKERQ